MLYIKDMKKYLILTQPTGIFEINLFSRNASIYKKEYRN